MLLETVLYTVMKPLVNKRYPLPSVPLMDCSIRPCLGTQFFQTVVFQILRYTLVMTLLQFTMLQFWNTTVSNTSRCLGKTLVETNQPERDPADALFTEKIFG
jgi:hypothetical protein